MIWHYSGMKSNMAEMLQRRQDAIFVDDPNGYTYEYDAVSNVEFLLKALCSLLVESVGH